MRFLTSLDLVKNELQNAVIQPLAVAPSSPKEGQIYYNSGDKIIYRYDGSNWGAVGVVYQQGSTTGAVITGLDNSGNVTTTNVTGLTLTGYNPITDGNVTAGMTLEQAYNAIDTAIKNTDAAVKTAQSAADTAQSTADAKVASVGATQNGGIEIGGTGTAPTVGIKLDSASGNAASLSANGLMVTIPEVTVPEYGLAKDTDAGNYAAIYHLTKDGSNIGEPINIPKDLFVKEGKIVDNPPGQPAGKYIELTLQNQTDPIYINVADLVDAYTSGNGITISTSNVISANVVAANGLSVDSGGIKMGLASDSANGAMSSGDFSKLSGIDTGATANTITLNGTETKAPSFYAPTDGGTSGQVLTSNGTGAPVWKNVAAQYTKYTANNAKLTASGGAFTWSISAATHGISNSALIVQIYEIATNQLVIADVVVNASNYNVTITINDSNSAGTLNADTYRVVIFG